MSPDAVHAQPAYTTTAKLLHWAVAVIVFALLGLGTAMVHVDWRFDTTVALYQAHKSFGMVVFSVMIARAAWRLTHPPSELPGDQNQTRQAIAKLVHGSLYAIVFLLPIVGWLQVSAAPIAFPTIVFGLVEIPHLSALTDLPAAQKTPWFERLSLIHRVLSWCLLALIVVHIVGAAHPRQHRALVWRRMALTRSGPRNAH